MPLPRKYSISEDPDLPKYTIMLLGDSCTGKTCLLIRFKDGHFLANNFISTVGIDYRNKIVPINGVKSRLQIWDTAGQERFRSVTTKYFRDAHAILLVFDLTNRKTFENIRHWLADIGEMADRNVKVCLVGNKADLDHNVTSSEARALADSYAIGYLETSAKTGAGVEEAFMSLARELTQSKLAAESNSKTLSNGNNIGDLNLSHHEQTKRCCTIM